MARVIEQQEAARRLGVTARALRDWIREPDFPDIDAGYDLDAIRAWRNAHQKKGSPASDTQKKLKLASEGEKLKQAQIKTKRDQLNLQEREGELLPRAAWERFAATLLSSLADAADQLPDLIGGDCCPKCKKKVPPRLLKELDRLREQLAEDLKQTPAEGKSS